MKTVPHITFRQILVRIRGNDFIAVDRELGTENSKTCQIFKCFSANSVLPGNG